MIPNWFAHSRRPNSTPCCAMGSTVSSSAADASSSTPSCSIENCSLGSSLQRTVISLPARPKPPAPDSACCCWNSGACSTGDSAPPALPEFLCPQPAGPGLMPVTATATAPCRSLTHWAPLSVGLVAPLLSRPLGPRPSVWHWHPWRTRLPSGLAQPKVCHLRRLDSSGKRPVSADPPNGWTQPASKEPAAATIG